MEKQGMDKRKRYIRIGLLILFFLLRFAPAGFPQAAGGDAGSAGEAKPASDADTANSLEARVEFSSAIPYVNKPWSIFVLVNHPAPSEVTIKPPSFPSSLILERVRTETRFIRQETAAPSPGIANNAEAAGSRWTRVEFMFTPQKAGAITIQPFQINVPARQAVTGAINLRIREEVQAVKRYQPRFRWPGTVPPVPAGEKGVLYLELGSWDPLKSAPKGFFQGRSPENAILEEGPAEAAGEGTFRYAISIMPLGPPSVKLDPFTFTSDAYTLTVPAVTIPVLPAVTAPDTPADTERKPGTAASLPAENRAAAFPNEPEKVFPLFRGEYRQIISRARALWDQNSRAEALAEIRKNERDSLSGPFLAPFRREMEKALGLGFTENEKWRPFGISLLTWATAGFLIISAFSIVFVFLLGKKNKKKNVTSPHRNGFKIVIAGIFLAGLVLILLEEGFGNFLIGRMNPPGNTAVLEKTPAYRVPDTTGAVNVWFSEGQPVTVGDCLSGWCYAESGDGKSGWVRREAVILY